MYLSRVEVPDARDPRRARRSRLEFARPDGGFAGWTVVVGRSQTGKSRLLAEISLAAGSPAREDPYAVAWSGESAPICLYYLERKPARPSTTAATAGEAADSELIAGLDPVEDIARLHTILVVDPNDPLGGKFLPKPFDVGRQDGNFPSARLRKVGHRNRSRIAE